MNALGFWRSRRGGVGIIAAFAIPPMLAFAALAVDLGSVYLQSRQLQGIADLAAIGAANDLSNAQAAASGTAGANGWRGAIRSVVVIGTYVADADIPASRRFTPGGPTPNAAQVTLTAPANLFFGASIYGSPTVNISRTATATSAQLASFSLGSRLAAVQGGIANSLLSGLTGSQVSLSVMDYNSLVGANVDLLQYSQALQTDLKLQGASFSQVLASQVSTGEALSVLANLLDTDGNDPAAQAMRKIAAAAGTATPAQLQNLIDLGPYASQDHTDAASGAGVSLNTLDLASAILQLAQGGRQVKLSMGAAVPGLANVDAWLAIGQRPSNSPWLTVTNDGSVVIRTAQTRLYIDAQVAPGAGVLSGAGVSLVNIPIYVETASAQAKLTGLNCPATAGAPAVTLAVEPSLGQIALGQINTSKLNDFTQPMTLTHAQLINALILQVTGEADTTIGGAGAWQSVSFSQSDIQADTTKTVSTNDIAQASVSSLLSNLNIQVQLLGAGVALGQNAVTSAMQSLLTTAASPLDLTINTLGAVLGVHLGEADVTVNGLRCHNAVLVA